MKKNKRHSDLPLFDFIAHEKDSGQPSNNQSLSVESVRFFGGLKLIKNEIDRKRKGGMLETLSRCPAGSILEKIVNLFWERTDMPLNMAFWFTLASLGGFLTQNNKRIKFGSQRIAPNLWISVLAKSCSGKTWILDRIMEISKNEIVFNGSGYQSKAAFIADMASKPEEGKPPLKHGILVIDELAQTVKLFRSNGAGATLKEAFLKSYDGKMSHTTLQTGKTEVSDINITILGATVLSTFADSITPEDLQDGFLQRIMLIIANESERNMQNWPYKIDEPDIAELKGYFETYAGKAKKINEFTLTPEAENIWKDWYFKHFNADLESHYKRYLWATLKIAAIFNTLLESDGIIGEADISWALRTTENALESLYIVMDKYLAFDKWEKLIQKARMEYEKNPDISDRDICRKLTLNRKVLNLIKTNLEDRGYAVFHANAV